MKRLGHPELDKRNKQGTSHALSSISPEVAPLIPAAQVSPSFRIPMGGQEVEFKLNLFATLLAQKSAEFVHNVIATSEFKLAEGIIYLDSKILLIASHCPMGEVGHDWCGSVSSTAKSKVRVLQPSLRRPRPLPQPLNDACISRSSDEEWHDGRDTSTVINTCAHIYSLDTDVRGESPQCLFCIQSAKALHSRRRKGKGMWPLAAWQKCKTGLMLDNVSCQQGTLSDGHEFH